MSQIDLPSDGRIARGAAKCKAILAALACPVPGCAEYCTAASIKAERPVVCVYQYGYVICSAIDTELPVSILPSGGELIEIRPLEPEDEWHPEKVIYVYRAALPRVKRLAKPDPPKRKPRNRRVTVGRDETPDSAGDEDNDELARSLGLI